MERLVLEIERYAQRLTQYNTIQYNTIQYNTIQYNTIQYNTIQYNTKPLFKEGDVITCYSFLTYDPHGFIAYEGSYSWAAVKT